MSLFCDRLLAVDGSDDDVRSLYLLQMSPRFKSHRMSLNRRLLTLAGCNLQVMEGFHSELTTCFHSNKTNVTVPSHS